MFYFFSFFNFLMRLYLTSSVNLISPIGLGFLIKKLLSPAVRQQNCDLFTERFKAPQ